MTDGARRLEEVDGASPSARTVEVMAGMAAVAVAWASSAAGATAAAAAGTVTATVGGGRTAGAGASRLKTELVACALLAALKISAAGPISADASMVASSPPTPSCISCMRSLIAVHLRGAATLASFTCWARGASDRESAQLG